jgi:hypothetical protein
VARCEQGYLCEICGQDVEGLTESALYLRFVIGEVRPDVLHQLRERHIRCDTELAQYIVDAAFEPIICTGPFAKAGLDADYVRERESLVTRGWQRLRQLPDLGLPILEYPLPEVLAAWQREE